MATLISNNVRSGLIRRAVGSAALWMFSLYMISSTIAGMEFNPIDWTGRAFWFFAMFGIVLGIGVAIMCFAEERSKANAALDPLPKGRR